MYVDQPADGFLWTQQLLKVRATFSSLLHVNTSGTSTRQQIHMESCVEWRVQSLTTVVHMWDEKEDHRASVTDSLCPPAARFFCQNGWSWYNNRCFKVINSPMTFHNAQEYCRTVGGHLASVSDWQHQNFLHRLTQGAGQTYVWLGGLYYQGRWQWADRSALYFSNWYYPYPSNPSRNPCMFLNSYKGWGNTNCLKWKSFICSVNCFCCV
uniref:C-type lectin domain-containing protein n=1 Tax=Salarias fasciatus TaxID=181472 RepID=A0A672F7G7_SALFA